MALSLCKCSLEYSGIDWGVGGPLGGLSLPQPNDNQLILSGMQWYQVCKMPPSPATFAYGNSTDFHIIT